MSEMKIRPSLETAKAFARTALPMFDDIIRELEKEGGWIRLPPEIVVVLQSLNISNWVEIFLDEGRFRMMQWRAIALLPSEAISELFLDGFDPESIPNDVNFESLPEATGDERTTALLEIFKNIPEKDQPAALDVFFKNLTVCMKDISELSDDMPPEENGAADATPEAIDRELIQKVQIGCMAFVTAFFNYLALAVHGQKMTTLVQRAINGDDRAFQMAVQIDKTLLTHLPQFREHYWRAVMAGKEEFLEHISYRLRNPILKARRAYPTLWFLLVVLDDMGILDKELTNEEILDLYKAIPEEHVHKPIDDVDYVRKQRAAYLRLKRQTK